MQNIVFLSLAVLLYITGDFMTNPELRQVLDPKFVPLLWCVGIFLWGGLAVLIVLVGWLRYNNQKNRQRKV